MPARPAIPFILLICAALFSGACRQREPGTAPAPASTVRAADPRAAGQLVSGFHGIEGGAWRWTERRFAVALGPPAGSAARGATLELRLTVPPQSIEKLGPITLAASIAGHALPPETYSKAGDYAYRCDVPPAVLASPSVKVEFELDKAMPPGDPDVRELGVVVRSVGLTAR